MIFIRPWLVIGRYRDTINLPLLDEYEIGAVLHLADYVNHQGITCLCMPIDDGVTVLPDKLRAGVQFVREQKAANQRVLVACGAGISRSVTFAIAALKEEENLTLLSAYRAILETHPEALPHPALWESLRQYYDDPLTFEEMWSQLNDNA